MESWRLEQRDGSQHPVRAPLLGRSKDQVDQLALYNEAFGSITDGHNNARIEVQIAANPSDEIVKINVSVPQEILESGNFELPIMTISTERNSGQSHSIEITNFNQLSDVDHLHYHRDREVVKIWFEGCSEQHGTLNFSFHAWELVEPLEGTFPYVYASLVARMSFPAVSRAQTLITVVTPKHVTPRSTQGSFLLAYPSRTFGEERHLNLYFPMADDIRLRYRFGPTKGLVEPWVSLGKAAVSAAFVFIVGASAEAFDESDRLLALIAAFIAIASVVWDLIREVSHFSIYGRVRSTIYFGVLASQILVVCVLAFTMFVLTQSSTNGLLRAATNLSGVIAGIICLAAVIGFYLHFQGWWHGYMCDHDGCTKLFRTRRQRPECRYTGRVMCDQHIKSDCYNCAHGEDLNRSQLITVAYYKQSDLRCISGTDCSQEKA